MVARPPVKVSIEEMRLDDLDAIYQIELASFSAPWPPNAYRSELESNRLATYLVARLDGQIVAYGGMWLMVDEAHITTFAVGAGSGSGNGCSSPSSTSRSVGTPGRRPSRSGSRTSRPGGCTRNTASGPSGFDRATTATTARTR
jgi:hypothetical protein